MKKSISLFLSVSLALPTILTTISSCATAAAENIITKGELLELINTAFNFEDNSSVTPDYPSIAANDPYYAAVRTAKSNEVLDALVSDFKTSEEVNREFLAMAVSGAIYHDLTDSVDIKDASKVTYMDDVLTVLNYGLMGLDDNGNFGPDEKVSPGDCAAVVKAGLDIWAHGTIIEEKYDVDLVDDVVDLAGLSDYFYNGDTEDVEFDNTAYNDTRKLLDDNNYSFDMNTGVVTVNSAEAIGLHEGSIATLPTGDIVNPYYPAKVTKIEQNADGTCTVYVEQASVDEYIANIDIAQEISPNFSNSVIYDGNGNVVSDDYNPWGYTSVALADDDIGNYVQKTSNNVYGYTETKFGTKNVKLPTPIGDFTLKMEDNDITVKADINLASDKTSTEVGIFQEGSASAKLCFSASFDFKDVVFDYEHSGTYFKLVSNSTLTHKYGLKATDTLKFGGNNAKEKGEYNYKTQAGLANAVIKKYKLCHMVIPTGIGDLCFNYDMYLQVSFSGEVSISFTNTDFVLGVERRPFNAPHLVQDSGTMKFNGIKVEATLELTLPMDLYFSVLFNVINVGLKITPGLGGKFSEELSNIDDEHWLLCVDGRVYPIVKGEIYGKLDFGFFGEYSLSFVDITICDSKHGPSESFHIEVYNGESIDIVDECTKDARIGAVKDAETEKAGVTVGDAIVLEKSDYLVKVGDPVTFNIVEMPSGYDYKDLFVITMDENVLPLNNGGSQKLLTKPEYSNEEAMSKYISWGVPEVMSGDLLTGYSYTATTAAEGITEFVVMTRDGKHKTSCNVYVGDEEKLKSDRVRLTTYGEIIPTGGNCKIGFDELPFGLTENDLIWVSEDTDIASVDQSGEVTGISPGYTIVTAKSPREGVTVACKITVNDVGVVTWRFLPDTAVEYQI